MSFCRRGDIAGNIFALALKIENNILLMSRKSSPDNIVVDKVSGETGLATVH
jgi:hypothetical protein